MRKAAISLKNESVSSNCSDKIRGRKPLPRSTAKYYVANGAPVKGKPMREVKQG